MNAQQKKEAVQKAINALAEAQSVEEIEEIVERGYEAARGSNDRKEALWAAEKAAKDRLSAK